MSVKAGFADFGFWILDFGFELDANLRPVTTVGLSNDWQKLGLFRPFPDTPTLFSLTWWVCFEEIESPNIDLPQARLTAYCQLA